MINYLGRSLFTILFIALHLSAVQAQTEMSKNIKNLIEKLYPNAEDIEYDYEDSDRTVYLLNNGEDVEITLTEDGNWLQITTFISFQNLPKSAQFFISETYEDQEDFTVIIRLKTKANTRYYVSFEADLKMISLTFDESGNLLEREVDDIDED